MNEPGSIQHDLVLDGIWAALPGIDKVYHKLSLDLDEGETMCSLEGIPVGKSDFMVILTFTYPLAKLFERAGAVILARKTFKAIPVYYGEGAIELLVQHSKMLGDLKRAFNITEEEITSP